MMAAKVKQMVPTCLCGRPMEFKEGETKTFCKAPGCGVVLKRGPEGYWAGGSWWIAFTPLYTPELVRRLNHYGKYMDWRNANSPKRRRRAGRRYV